MNRGNTGFKSYFNDTLHQHNFDVGATFTFKDGKSISEHNAKYLLKLFLNELSEVYFGKHRDRNNVHVERVVLTDDEIRNQQLEERRRVMRFGR